MKRVIKIPKKPQEGDIRVRSFYALFPFSITKEEEIETRYFERVFVKEKYVSDCINTTWSWYWKPVEFTNKEEYDEQTT
jgi:hypothetical protein